VVIFNPFAGPKKNGRKTVEQIVKPMLIAAGIQVELVATERQGHATTLARDASLDGVDAVLALGGDGTLNEVLTGLLTRSDGAIERVALGFLPGGTGNSFCRDYLLDGRPQSFGVRTQVKRAVQAVIDGGTRGVDAIRMDAHDLSGNPAVFYSMNIIGWGIGVDAAVAAEAMRCLGGLRYDVAIVREIFKLKKRPCKLTLDGEVVDSASMFLVLAQNNVHAGKGLKLAPAARLDDGLVDVVYADGTSHAGVRLGSSRLSRAGASISTRRRHSTCAARPLASRLRRPHGWSSTVRTRRRLPSNAVCCPSPFNSLCRLPRTPASLRQRERPRSRVECTTGWPHSVLGFCGCTAHRSDLCARRAV
jgi:diacylglycerol kinase (ATP)